jgi:hypothetical protein
MEVSWKFEVMEAFTVGVEEVLGCKLFNIIQESFQHLKHTNY